MRATVTTKSLAKSIALTINGLIDTLNVSLLTSADEISRQISTGKADEQSINNHLIKQKERLGYADFIRATNANGDSLYGAGVISSPINIADRDYFIQLRDNQNAGLVISKPVIGRIDNKWVWIFARRINKADGSFAGVIYSSIFVEDIHKIFEQIKIDHYNIITLRDAAMLLVARYSTNNAFFPSDDKGVSAAFTNALQANPNEGSYISNASKYDDASHSYSYFRNSKYGFYVNVGVVRQEAFAEWYKQAWGVSGLVFIFALILLVFSRLIIRGWVRQEEDMAALHETQKIANLGSYNYDLHTDRWTSSDLLDKIFGIGPYYKRDTQGWLKLVAPKHRQELQAYLDKVIEHKLQFDLEYCIIRHSDSQTRWVHHKGPTQIEVDGNTLTLVGTVQDITDRKLIQEALRESEDQFRTIAASAQDAIIMMDADGAISFWNPAAEAIFGYTAQEVLGQNLHHLLAPERFHAAFNAGIARFRTSGEGGAVGRMIELAALRKDGIEIPIELSLSAVRRKDQWIAISIVRNISERKKSEAALQDSHEALQSILKTTPDGFWRADSQGNLLEVNPAYCQMSGYTREELLGMRISDLEAMESLHDTTERIRYIATYGSAQFETMHRRKDGSIWNIEASITYRNAAGGQVLAFLRDITERKQLQKELHQKASTDDLTGLINRRHFMELAHNEHRRAIRLHHSLAVVLIDLDRLKQINDMHGHAAGDLVLQALAHTIQQNIREIDIFARLGGDEFVLLLPGARSEQAYDAIERARQALATRPLDIFGIQVLITISAGIASVSSDEDTFDVLMNRADQCLYQSKAAGRNRVTVELDLF